jgi:hypothetical protein
MKTDHPGSRREFLKDLAFLSAAVTALRSADPLVAAPLSPGTVPSIKLGNLTVSRLILGSNPFFGFAHGNPQGTEEEMKAYYTEDRIMAVLDAAADQGITAVWAPCYDHWMRLWTKYREKGGRLRNWIAQPDPEAKQMKAHIRSAAQNGAAAVCIQGICADEQMKAGRFDVLREWLELIHSFGLSAGMASHQGASHLVAEEKNLPTDFYHQTLYRPDNYVPEGLAESLETIAKLAKPVVAYKVLGAGRIPPKDMLPYVLKRLKPKDGICIGVFPRTRDEIGENCEFTRQFSKNEQT